jgi:hypothetical protein
MKKFDWHPKSFDEVVEMMSHGTAHDHQQMTTTIQRTGPLSCPAPTWDAKGTYRIGRTGAGKLEVQKLKEATGQWAAAPLHAPEATATH